MEVFKQWELGIGIIGNDELGLSIKIGSSLKIFGHRENNQVLTPNSNTQDG